MKNPIPMPDREELLKLRVQGMNREEIASHYGVAVSRVKRWIKELDIPNVATRSAASLRKQRSPQAAALDDDFGLTLVERAKRALGSRMTNDYRGYLLDGRPVRVDILIRAAGLEVPEIP